MVWRYVPMKTSTFANGQFRTNVPVEQIIIHPPGSKHGGPIIPTAYAVEIRTAFGKRWQGFKNACIDASLRVAVDTTGREADEVVAKWKKAPKNPCGSRGGLGACRGRACRARKRRR